jgi:hypothetical protein
VFAVFVMKDGICNFVLSLTAKLKAMNFEKHEDAIDYIRKTYPFVLV